MPYLKYTLYSSSIPEPVRYPPADYFIVLDYTSNPATQTEKFRNEYSRVYERPRPRFSFLNMPTSLHLLVGMVNPGIEIWKRKS